VRVRLPRVRLVRVWLVRVWLVRVRLVRVRLVRVRVPGQALQAAPARPPVAARLTVPAARKLAAR